MRNLKLLCHRHCDCAFAVDDDGETFVSIDSETSRVFVARKNSVVAIDESALKVLWRSKYERIDDIVGIHWSMEHDAVVVATIGGDLMLMRLPPSFPTIDEHTSHPKLEEIDEVGAFSGGCRAMAFSPDEELLVVLTGDSTFVLVTVADFEPLMEESYSGDSNGTNAFVDVGWGKKETQFHGSEGKAAAVRTSSPPATTSSFDDGRPRVVWRGDGQHFAVSFLQPADEAIGVPAPKRKIHIYSRDGSLHSTSEDIAGLEHALCWRPAGNLLASTVRRPNNHAVTFFEPNGLRHGEYFLPFPTNGVVVSHMAWNANSDVFAVIFDDTSDSDASISRRRHLQLWTCSNYHWYLKQSLSLGPPTCGSALLWDAVVPYRLHVVDGIGVYREFEWSLAVDRSTTDSSESDAQVSVIDGISVKVTPFRILNVPPPMFAYELKHPIFVNSLCASPRTANDLAALGENLNQDVDENRRWSLFLYSATITAEDPVEVGFHRRATPLSLRRRIELTIDDSYNAHPQHFTWVQEEIFVLVIEGSLLYKAVLTTEDSVTASPLKSFHPSLVRSLTPSNSSDFLFVHLDDGRVGELDLVSGVFNEVIRWRSPCETVLTTSFPDTPEAIVGLSFRGDLFIDDIEISDSATSIAIHRDFVLYTTTKHECLSLRRSSSLSDLRRVLSDRGGKTREDCLTSSGYAVVRPVERGSQIVTVIPSETSLILEMPRGNLETVHPKALLLTAVEKLLRAEKYRDAIKLMRRHRLNMNLLHDFDPKEFMNKINIFVEQIADAHLFNLFLTDLENTDYCCSLYRDFYSQRSPATFKNKVNDICDKMVFTLCASDKVKFITSVLTALVKKSPPETAAALEMLRTLRAADEESASKALNYLVCLTDVNDLFDEALGTYDLETVVMVAEKSQKDPKEYLPFLNKLNRLEIQFRNYTIDMHLKRWEKALFNIHSCGDKYFKSHALPLIEEHVLYSQGLRLFDRKSPSYKTISAKFGDFLIKKRRYEEAGVVLSRVGLYEEAFLAFKLTGDWRQMVCMAAYLKMGPTDLARAAREMGDLFRTSDRHLEASVLFEQYAGDVEEAIVILVEGREWDEALRLMHKYGRIDFIESHLKDSLVSSSEELMAAVEALHEQFSRHAERLVLVRREKKGRIEDASLLMEEDKDGDLYSEITSASGFSRQSAQSNASSSFSKISGKTNKAKRKQEKKLDSLKEGGAFEHVALVKALYTIFDNVNKLKPEVSRLIKVLMQFHFEDESVRLADAMGKLEEEQRLHVDDIWPSTAQDVVDGTDYSIMSIGPSTTANSIAASFSLRDDRVDEYDFHLLAPHMRHPPVGSVASRGEFRLDIVASASEAIVHRSAKAEQ